MTSTKTESRDRSFIYRHRVALYFVLGYALVWGMWSTIIAQQNGLITWHIPENLGYYGITVAALVMAGLAEGKAGIIDLLRRMFRWQFSPVWWILGTGVPAGLPIVALGTYTLMGGAPQVGVMLPVGAFGLYILSHGTFFWGTEELGWRGFALPRLLQTHSALSASLILGVVWGIWHTPLFLIANEGQNVYPYAGFVLFTVLESVLMTWIYVNTKGSVLMAGIVHLVTDGALLFSGALTGDQLYFWVAVAVYAAAATVIVLVEGPQHLSRRQSRLEAGVVPAPAGSVSTPVVSAEPLR